MDHCTLCQPRLQFIRRSAQSMLYVAAIVHITRIGLIQAQQMPVSLPLDDLVGEQEIVRALTLAEQQPVAVLPVMRGFAQQAAQAGDARAVADQHHRRTRLPMEARIAMHAGGYRTVQRRMQGQPARAQSGAASCVVDQPHHQLHFAIGGA